jgi:hypothetical protein
VKRALLKRFYFAVGWYFHRKWQRRVKQVGAFAAAKALRKQGVRVSVARLLVAYRPIPTLYDVVIRGDR